MTIATFIPPIDPSPGTSDKPEINVVEADFGDGYSQATRQLNNVRRVMTLKWDVLDANETVEIIDFLAAQGGTTPFHYKVPGEAAPILWTCKDYQTDYAAVGYRSITATLRQSFNIVG